MVKLSDGTPIQRPNRTILSRTLFLLIVCGVVAFLVLTFRLYRIQIKDHERYESLAIGQQTLETKIPAFRGTICDRNKTVLAVSSSAYSVYLSPFEAKYYSEDKEKIARILGDILGTDRESVLKKAEDEKAWYKTIAVKIEPETADELRDAIRESGIRSIHIENDNKRWYPFSELACHIIGFVGIDGNGLEGIEALYDKYLAGEDGYVSRLAAANGTDMLSGKYAEYIDSIDGCSLELTIDAGVQQLVEKNVRNAIADYDVKNGACAIVMKVKTGETLAMCSIDSYDLNDYLSVGEDEREIIDSLENPDEKADALRKARLKQWRNKAISDTYEPGSVFKIITLSMGLDSGAVSENDSFYCGGSMKVLGRNKPLNCWKHSGHGSQSLKLAVAHSCNVALVNIGMKIGAERFYDYAKAFGLFDKTGIDLIGEANSQWWSEDVFFNETNLSQLAAASFGQTFTVTPIQVITAISAAVNGGNLMQPYVVSKAIAADGTFKYEKSPTVVRRVIKEETSAKVREIFEYVVSGAEGTGKGAAVEGYRIGGKTGTSEKVGKEIVNGHKEYIVSFCGVAPMDDPEIAVLLLLDTPSGDTGLYISGGNMAAPAVGKIFADILPYLGYEKTSGK